MSKQDSFPTRILLRNGAWLTIPLMIIGFGLRRALPLANNPDLYWSGIPGWVTVPENTFRMLVFSLPAILYLNKGERVQYFGWYLYFGGLGAYLASYLLQIGFPNSVWSQSLFGFTAPAWTTLFWCTGIGLVCAQSWLSIRWYKNPFISAFPFTF